MALINFSGNATLKLGELTLEAAGEIYRLDMGSERYYVTLYKNTGTVTVEQMEGKGGEPMRCDGLDGALECILECEDFRAQDTP